MTVDVFSCYYSAEYEFSGVPRRGALVTMTSDSEAGTITYTASVTFFPHRDETDFGVSYDAYFSKVLFSGKGRRSKKREAALLDDLQDEIAKLIADTGAKVFWDRPLREARRG